MIASKTKRKQSEKKTNPKTQSKTRKSLPPTKKAKATSDSAADTEKKIRRAVDSGKVVFGTKQSEKTINTGTAKLLIVSKNAPILAKEKILAKAKVAKIPFLEFDGVGLELGSVCGKPFTVSFMAINNPGKSSILKDLEGKKR